MITDPYVYSNGTLTDIMSLNLECGMIHITGEINDEMATYVVSQLMYLDANRTHGEYKEDGIKIYINSPGGSVSAGLAIYDVMKSMHCDVSTICIGNASSMAAVLLSGGTKGKRFITKHSNVMIHQPSGGSGGQATDVKIQAEHIIKVRRNLCEILAENCGRSIDEIEPAIERDNWLDAKEAKRFGLVDQILNCDKEEKNYV